MSWGSIIFWYRVESNLMKINTFEDLFTEQIQDLYSAEEQVVNALPKMAEAADSPELQRGFQMHLEQTHQQIDRLKNISNELNIPLPGETCKGMAGILDEGKEFLGGEMDPKLRDAGLIVSAQRVEHYEISGYGSARTFASRLGYANVARMLQQTLDEEKETDQKLSALAEQGVNPQAQMRGLNTF